MCSQVYGSSRLNTTWKVLGGTVQDTLWELQYESTVTIHLGSENSLKYRFFIHVEKSRDSSFNLDHSPLCGDEEEKNEESQKYRKYQKYSVYAFIYFYKSVNNILITEEAWGFNS